MLHVVQESGLLWTRSAHVKRRYVRSSAVLGEPWGKAFDCTPHASRNYDDRLASRQTKTTEQAEQNHEAGGGETVVFLDFVSALVCGVVALLGNLCRLVSLNF
jgi:hypothetical protein